MKCPERNVIFPFKHSFSWFTVNGQILNCEKNTFIKFQTNNATLNSEKLMKDTTIIR